MKQLLPLALALTAIAAIAALALALVYQVTEAPIQEAETAKRIEAIQNVLPGIDYSNVPEHFPGQESFVNTQMAKAARQNDKERLAELCGDSMKGFLEDPKAAEREVTAPDWFEKNGYWYFIAKNSEGKPLAAAARVFSNNGYSGYVETYVGITLEGKIIGLRVTEHRETPGLGTKIEDDSFKDQFLGKSLNNADGFKLEVTKENDPKKIQAIAGATISTRAVTDPIRRGLEFWDTSWDAETQTFSSGGESAEDSK